MSEQDASDATDAPAETEADAADAHEHADGESADQDGTEFPFADVEAPFDDADFEAEFGDEVPDQLEERVAEADPESVAHELAALRSRVAALEDQLDAREEELDDVTSKLKRKQADFQNYKKRMEKRREQEKQRATEDLVERLLEVRDNLVRALDQEASDVDDLRGGVESTLRTFDRELEAENVTVVDPEPGEEVDPQRHEVLMRVDSDQPEDSIADVHRPGYVMAEKVIQSAQVTVSDGPAENGGDADSDAAE
jgi:molecular chaperone GrpE